MKRFLPTESSIQSSYILWLNLQYPKIADVTAAFANGGLRDGRYGHRLRCEGLKKGFPDIGMFVARGEYHGMFIEFKSAKGIISKEQFEVMSNLETQGYLCRICRSLDEAINETIKYLEQQEPYKC